MFKKWYNKIILLMMPFLLSANAVFAVTYNGDPTNPDDKVNGAIWWVGIGCRAAGIISIVFGAFQLAMSFSNDEPGYRTKSIVFLVCGVILFTGPILMQALMNWQIIDPSTWH